MHFKKRTTRGGKSYYSFLYWDPIQRKNKRIAKSEVPSDIDTPEKAEKFAKEYMAKIDSASFRIQQKLAYKKQYFKFDELEELYAVYMRDKAPVDYINSVRDLKYFVFDFFLNKKDANNVNEWPLLYIEFKDWLENTAVTIKSKKNLSYSQMNSAISTLNTFIELLIQKNKIFPSTVKCRRFEKHKVKRRTVDDVLSKEELDTIVSTLKNIDRDVAEFVQVSAAMGGRFAETLGLALDNVYNGTPQDKNLQNILKQNNIACIGYFGFNTQLVNPSKPRGVNGSVTRKQLKHRQSIEISDLRIVPIFESEIWDIVADRFNSCRDDYNNKKYGTKYSDYLLFEGLTEQRINKFLKEAYSVHPKFKVKTIHCLRHTFATNLAGQVSSDHRMFQITMGHKDQRTTEGYNHIYNSISRTVATQQSIDLGGLKRINPKKT